MITDELEQVTSGGVDRVRTAASLEDLRAAEQELLGKRSPLAAFNQRLGSMPVEERKEAGRRVNEARSALVAAVEERRLALADEERRQRLDAERLDLTEVLPVPGRGHLHLSTQTRDELEDVFIGMGYQVAEGPEAEDDWHNFEALNMPPAHPARRPRDPHPGRCRVRAR